MSNSIEKVGIKIVKNRLRQLGFRVDKSDNKTFDLKVNDINGGRYAEVKSKKNSYNKLDFITLTKNQEKALKKQSFDIYLVCGVEEKTPTILKINSKYLAEKTPRIIFSYEYRKSLIKELKEENKAELL